MKMSEDIINHSETYRQIFDTTMEGIMVVQNEVVVLTNSRCERLFAYDSGELLGKPVNELIIYKSRNGQVINLEHVANHASQEELHRIGKFLAYRKDGKNFPVEINLNYCEVDGEASIVIHILDVSHRKRVEDNLREREDQFIHYIANLEERVLERTKELEEVVETLQIANENLKIEVSERIRAQNEAQVALEREKDLHELKTRFVSMASHEFRTPLSTILSSISLVAQYNSPEVEDKRNRHINRIKSKVAELTNILNDFLSIDKLEAGKMTAFLQPFNICELVSETIAELRPITKKGQRLLVDFVLNTGEVKSDAQILKQCVMNLISNAIKYSHEGGDIKIHVSDSNNKLCISVQDYGIGIPLKDQKHMFDKFFRAHNSSHIQGTGLGLNIVKKYLKLIDGSITFQSEEGIGSIFTIHLVKA